MSSLTGSGFELGSTEWHLPGLVNYQTKNLLGVDTAVVPADQHFTTCDVMYTNFGYLDVK